VEYLAVEDDETDDKIVLEQQQAKLLELGLKQLARLVAHSQNIQKLRCLNKWSCAAR
jgi:hypothetical protein